MSHKRPAVQQAAPAVSHRLLLADELGMWKACEVTEGQWSTPAIVQRWGVPNKALAVHAMAVGLTTGGSYGVPLVALARPGGTIDMYDSLEGTAQGSIGSGSSSEHGSSERSANGSSVHDIVGLAFMPFSAACGASTSGEQQGGLLSQALLSCTASGLVRIHKQIRISVPAVSPPEGQSEEEKESAPIQEPTESCSWEETSSFQTPLHRCPSLCPSQAVDSSNRYLAVGGEGYNLQVWDIQTRLEVFHAKGGKPSRCGLTDLAHITALAFLPTPAPTSPEEPLTDARRVLVGTAKHKLWLYDTAAGKRPQLEVSWGECRITSVVAELDGGGRISSGRGYTPSPRGGRGGRGASQAPVKRQRSSRDD
ncbi:MAG: hypothetical protein WDW38_002996 [Sanguina aurantia]